MMASQKTVLGLCVCICVVLVVAGTGFDFQMSETSPFNRQLQCSVDANNSSLDILTIIGLTISDVTNNETVTKLAAISVLDTNLYVDHVRKSFLAVQGSISQHYADLVVTFTNQTYCLLCSYMCELNFINPAGHPVVRHSTVRSTPSGSDVTHFDVSASVASQIMSAVDRLTDITHDVEDRLTNMEAVNEDSNKRLTNMETVNEDSNKRLTNMEAVNEDSNKRLTNIEAVNEETKMALARLEEKLDNMTAMSATTPAVKENKEIDMMPQTTVAKECKQGMANMTREPRILVTVLDNIPAVCDTQSDGGGWIIFQRRTNGKENFYRPWKDYKTGFGDVEGGGDFWLGLQYIHQITSMGNFELRIDMERENKKYYAKYSSFYVGNLLSQYTLSVGSYSGNVTDSLAPHNNDKFTTYDRDNDDDSGFNCAKYNHGAWWYYICHVSNLNGLWGDTSSKGLYWHGIGAMSFTEMKMRLVT